MKFTKNESVMDRWIRAILAIVLFLVAIFWLRGGWQILFYILAVISLFTALTGFCALYKLFGIATNRGKETQPNDKIE